MNKLLEVKNLCVHFFINKGLFRPKKILYAVNDVSFDVGEGEILGIVGESGCGKSSLGLALVNLNKITHGEILFQGQPLSQLNKGNEARKNIQYIFQDPIASLNPRMTVFEIIAEPLKVHYPHLLESAIIEQVLAMMKQVGLSEHQLYAYPQEFSGGQCQRISIARALILKPKLIICDESVSALDVSIKSQIINLLKDLQQKFHLTIIFISHDLGVLKHLCDKILVMYLGKVMEISSHTHLDNFHHPYSQALLSAVLVPDPKFKQTLKLIEGTLPSPTAPPPGCVFSSRCPLADEKCQQKSPPMIELSDGTKAACFKIPV